MNKLMALVLFCLVMALSAFAAEYIIDVPEGQVVSNTTDNIQAATAGDVLVKTGKGTYYTNKKIGDQVNFSRMEVREGTVEMASATSYFHPPILDICAGAKLKQLGGAAYNNNGVTIQIDAGGEWDQTCQQCFPEAVTGSGVIANCGSTTSIWTPERLADFTGFFRIASPNITGSQLHLYGDVGSYADHLGGIEGAYTDANLKNSKLVISSTTPACFEGPIWGTLQVDIKDSSVLTFRKARMRNTALGLSGILTNENPRASIVGASPTLVMSSADDRYVQKGGRVVGAYPATSTALPLTRLKRANGISMSAAGTAAQGTIILTDGAEFHSQYQQQVRTEVYSGSSYVINGGTIQTGKGTEDAPVVQKFDGGRLVTDFSISDRTQISINNPTKFKYVVGANGMTIDTCIQTASRPTAQLAAGLRIENETGTAGALTLLGSQEYVVNTAFSLAGPVICRGADLTVGNQDAFKTESAQVFGSGSLYLENAKLKSSLPKGSLLRLANAAGAKLLVDGSATINITSSTVGNDFVLGPSDATAVALVINPRSALFFESEIKSGLFKDGTASFMVNGGDLPLAANGKILRDPIFSKNMEYSISGDSWGGQIDFLTYDGTDGLKYFSDYTEGVEGGADSVAKISVDTVMAEGDERTVAALNVGGKSLKIPAGTTLHVGTGSGTAHVLLSNDGGIRASDKKGTGTLDFGGATGIFARSRRASRVMVNITGTGGVAFLAPNFGDVNGLATSVGGNNTYSGGTVIAGERVQPTSDTAFSTGEVRVTGNSGRGGQLKFDSGATKISLANRMYLSGYGLTQGNGVSDRTGAVWAKSSADFNGAVELTGATRMVVEKGAEVTFNGMVSGDALQLFNRTDSVTNAGAVVFAQANSCTGLVEVIRSTLVLKAGATAGTGDIELDGGVLRLEGSAMPRVMTSLVRGAGTVVLDGPKNTQVTFRGPADETDPFLQQEHELDLNGRNRIVNSLKGFTSVKSSFAKQVHLSVLDDAEGSFAGEVAENVVLHYGKVYAPGLTLIVR